MSSSKPLPVRFEYSLKAAKETRFLLSSLQDLQVENIDTSKVKNEYYHQWEYDHHKGEFRLDFRVVFTINGQVFIDYGVRIFFSVKALEGDNIHDQLLLNFYGITISTIRGMLVARLLGSDHSNIFIPIFHPSEIRELFLHT